jgi:hypothetical protein
MPREKSAATGHVQRPGRGECCDRLEQVEGRKPQRGAYFHTGPEDLFAAFGFERDRKIATWRWVMRRRVTSATTKAP